MFQVGALQHRAADFTLDPKRHTVRDTFKISRVARQSLQKLLHLNPRYLLTHGEASCWQERYVGLRLGQKSDEAHVLGFMVSGSGMTVTCRDIKHMTTANYVRMRRA